jgi:SAM-dependent methyltransferase
VVHTDVIDDGARLAKFGEESVDFVVANHVLEHIEDPIAALGHWLGVLRPGGVLLLTLPDARHIFDAPRGRTTVEQLLLDRRDGPLVSREDHFTEWARPAEHLPAELIAQRVVELYQASWAIHFHVWELDGFLDLLRALKLPARIEATQAVAPEFSVILRKQGSSCA